MNRLAELQEIERKAWLRREESSTKGTPGQTPFDIADQEWRQAHAAVEAAGRG